jgi:hypothetical protein
VGVGGGLTEVLEARVIAAKNIEDFGESLEGEDEDDC